ncbi:hypothetical protein HY524_00200 [Candidatus Berkelbacteria bacterium]|nr:hypothetical protein [Candidatus Berkelbacteria bacterium]
MRTQLSSCWRIWIFLGAMVIALLGRGTQVWATAGIAQLIPIQGKVVNSNGTNVTDGTYDFVFKLYDAASSGANTLFTESWTAAGLWSSTMSTAPASGGESLTYSTDTNESTIKVGQILTNTTKVESVVVVAVNSGTNVITISPTRQAWATSDTVTNKLYVKDGIFHVNLNSLNADLSGVDFNTTSIFAGINFNADGEMKPRIQYGAAPYAMNARKVSGLTVTDTTGTLTIANSKTVTVNNTLTFAGTDSTTITFQGTDTYVGRATTDTLTNKTLTSPKIGTSIQDTNGINFFTLTATASAVNYLTYANAAINTDPTFTATGSDTNIGIALSTKGSDNLVITRSTASTDALALAPSTGGAATFTGTLQEPDLSANVTWTLPSVTSTLATLAGTETLTSKTLTSPVIGTSPTAAGATWADLGTVTTIDINGGTVDGVTIGGLSAGAGTFTTISGTTLTGSTAGNVLTATNTTDSSSSQVAILQGDRATMADADAAYVSFKLSNDGGTQTEVSRLTWIATDVNAGTSVDGRLDFSVMTAGSLVAELQLDGTALSPSTGDGLALGTSTLMYSDLFLASGAVENYNNGDVTVTHSTDTLTLAGGTLVLPASGLQVGSSNPFSDSAGTLTLQNVDALDATTESTVESAIDTLANLTAASSLASVGTITTGVWNAGALTSSGGISGTTLTATSTVSLGNNTATFAVDATEFDISATTGAITINDGGDAGAISIEGTNLDINSLDFTGAGTITSGSNTNLALTSGGTGDLVVNLDTDTNLQVTASAAPGVDMLALTNSGQVSTTTGVDGLSLTFGSSNASGDIVNLTPSYAGGATDLLTYNVLEVAAFSPTNAAGTDTINGLKFGNLTDPGATVTSSAISVGTGWDTILGGTTAGTNLVSFTNFGVTTAGNTTTVSTDIGGGYGSTGVTISTAGNIQANGTLTVDSTINSATLSGTALSGNGNFTLTGATAVSGTLTFSSTASATKGKILFGTSGYDEVNNRLGIGTASPAVAVEANVGSNSSEVYRAASTNTAGYVAYSLYPNAYSGYLYGFGSTYATSGRYVAASTLIDAPGAGGLGLASSNASGAIIFYANGDNERMRIASDGKVGINTGSPGSTLDVKGTLRLSGSTSGYVGFSPAAIAGSTTYTLPSADGTGSQALSTNGSGTLAWGTFLDNSLANGRLTLTNGTAVTTSDVTAATTIYYTPFKGNRIALYDGTNWNIRTFSELSKALGTLSNATNYDVFIYDNSGTATIDTLVAWTSDTARATALVLQDGVYVKSGATTRRYVGTIRTTATTTTEDSAAKRYVWNVQNRTARKLTITESTSNWNYSLATWRSANGSASNRVQYVVGLAEDDVAAQVQVMVTNSGNAVAVGVGVGVDSTNANSADIYGGFTGAANMGGLIAATYHGIPGIGFHYLQWLEEATATGTTTWYSNFVSGMTLMGLTGTVQG